VKSPINTDTTQTTTSHIPIILPDTSDQLQYNKETDQEEEHQIEALKTMPKNIAANYKDAPIIDSASMVKDPTLE